MSESNTSNGDPIVGRTVVKVRTMTDDEMEKEWWRKDNIHGRPTAIEFDDGTIIYAARDPEGNGPGALFGMRDDTPFTFAPPQQE